MGAGELTRREKELVAVAVSATNNCEYCIRAHTAALKGLGISEKGVLELMAVVGLFNNFNKVADGLLIESDLGA
jgi:AhpD family alkylhydroperoxidase